jgi:rhodanese-related sulfurtransferase
MYEIVPHLYLSNYTDAKDVPYDFFVINCSKDLPIVNSKYGTRLAVNDDLRKESIDVMTRNIPLMIRYIEEHVNKGHNVLVHCAAGQQRSAAVVAAYLIKTKGFSVDKSVEFVKSKKPDAFLTGVNFRESLKSFALSITNGDNQGL